MLLHVPSAYPHMWFKVAYCVCMRPVGIPACGPQHPDKAICVGLQGLASAVWFGAGAGAGGLIGGMFLQVRCALHAYKIQAWTPARCMHK